MIKKNYSISVIIPIYNEATIIGSAILKICTFMRQNFDKFEILIVESGSTDGSTELCEKVSNNYKEVRVIHEEKRNGFGAALKIGYKQAVNELVWLITADIPFPLKSINKAIPLFKNVDCVLSYRVSDKRKVFRRVQSFIYNALIKVLFGLKVKHFNSAFKVFKRSLIQSIQLDSNGWFCDVEIIYRLKEKRIDYIEIPIEFIDRIEGSSKISIFTPISIIKEIILFLYSIKRRF